MSGFYNCRECITEVACEKAGRCFNGSSASGLPEPAAPLGAFALARGSVPVSSAEALADEWENKAMGYMKTAPAARDAEHRARIEAVCDTLWHCAKQLRRRMEYSDERQPAPNT